MVIDAVERIGKSIVQHGHLNQRIYVMRMSPDDIPDIIPLLDELAKKEGYSKIFVKVPESTIPVFSAVDYIVEATVPYFYHGLDSAVFMGKYFIHERNRVYNTKGIADILSASFKHAQDKYTPQLPKEFSLTHANFEDVQEIAAFYRSAFKTYPFPIFDPDFIKKSMSEDVCYFCIRQSNRIVAVASCEVNTEFLNAEMTDFATNPLFQGKGLAGNLLYAMETEMKNDNIRLAYTIARATSFAINILFARAGYQYAGMLPNNTNISGAMESMNVWYRKL